MALEGTHDLDFDDELFDRIFDKHFKWSKSSHMNVAERMPDFLIGSRLPESSQNRQKNWKINAQCQTPLVLPPKKKLVSNLSFNCDSF